MFALGSLFLGNMLNFRCERREILEPLWAGLPNIVASLEFCRLGRIVVKLEVILVVSRRQILQYNLISYLDILKSVCKHGAPIRVLNGIETPSIEFEARLPCI
jgi:hypothetical protein